MVEVRSGTGGVTVKTRLRRRGGTGSQLNFPREEGSLVYPPSRVQEDEITGVERPPRYKNL